MRSCASCYSVAGRSLHLCLGVPRPSKLSQHHVRSVSACTVVQFAVDQAAAVLVYAIMLSGARLQTAFRHAHGPDSDRTSHPVPIDWACCFSASQGSEWIGKGNQQIGDYGGDKHVSGRPPGAWALGIDPTLRRRPDGLMARGQKAACTWVESTWTECTQRRSTDKAG